MPSCITLVALDGHNKAEPGRLDGWVVLDEELCALLGESPDPVKFVAHWYDIICPSLAMGFTLLELRGRYEFMQQNHEQKQTDTAYVVVYRTLIKIVDYLIENYSTDAWKEWK